MYRRHVLRGPATRRPGPFEGLIDVDPKEHCALLAALYPYQAFCPLHPPLSWVSKTPAASHALLCLASYTKEDRKVRRELCLRMIALLGKFEPNKSRDLILRVMTSATRKTDIMATVAHA